MNKLESLLNEIVQEAVKTLMPLKQRVDELHNLLYEASQNGSEEEKVISDQEKQAKKDFKDARKNCKIWLTEKYSSSLIEAVKLANSEGNDTNPVYSGEIEEYKGASFLHIVAKAFSMDAAQEMLPYIRPQDIKRGSGLKIESELMAAIEEKNVALRDWLLENDPDLMYQKKSGSSALHIACMIKDYDATERLIKRVAEEKGSDAVKEFVNSVNTYGCTPLFDALAMGSHRGYQLDSNKMLKFLDLFIENGVELGKVNSGECTGEYTIFNRIITSAILEDLDLPSAVVKMLSSGQDMTIDLGHHIIQRFFTNESNIQKILMLGGYSTSQKTTALDKIKEALVDHNAGASHESAIHLIDQYLAQLTQDHSIESNTAVSEVASGIEHIDIDPNAQAELLGNSHNEEVTEG